MSIVEQLQKVGLTEYEAKVYSSLLKDQFGPVATTKAKIYVEYDGKEANTGSVALPDRVFNIVWRDGKILEISAMEYSKCVKCLRDTFEMAWRYSEK